MSDVDYSRRAAGRAALLRFAATCCATAYVASACTVAGLVAWPGKAVADPAAAERKATQEERLELVTASGVHAIDVEIAATPEKQALGLMYRTSLPDTKGMLFPHKEPREMSMWMRNTYIPLDMVFIRPDGTVHRIEARTEPFSERIISSGGPVTAVLEIAGGAAERMGLKPGDKVRHPVFGSTPSP